MLQLLLLSTATYAVTRSAVSAEIWYLAGVFAVVVNPQLLEPWYPKPQDVLANSLIATVLFAIAPKTVSGPGWAVMMAFLVIVALAALVAIVLGAGREEGPGVAAARSAQSVARVGSATLIYSVVFWLALLEYRPPTDSGFWILGGAWAAVLLLGAINWQSAWAVATRTPLPCTPEGVVGPSILRLSGTVLPPSGSVITLKTASATAEGIVMTRIQRATDAWGEVFVASGSPEELVRSPTLTIDEKHDKTHDIVGAVDAGSTDRVLRFVAPEPLRIGEVVTVEEKDQEILYQITFAEVDRSDVRGGAHLIVRARATQLGMYSPKTGVIVRHQWVPSPGRAVRRASRETALPAVPETWVQIGNVSGTQIPVFMDIEAATQGHLTILGMTRMGKTSFAVQLAVALARSNSVLIMDQTGEYIQKRGLPLFAKGQEDSNGISVFEPEPGEVPAQRALACLEWLVDKAASEYAAGEPRRRILLLEEAHQFVPEPAGLGFNAPGRDEAYKFGLLMMQIRKYGLSAILISQRTAVVAKSALSQCETIIAFKSVDQTGLDYLQSLMGDEARVVLPTLRQGQAVAFGPSLSVDSQVVIDVIPPDTWRYVPDHVEGGT